jgi:hypothetical protein
MEAGDFPKGRDAYMKGDNIFAKSYSENKMLRERLKVFSVF